MSCRSNFLSSKMMCESFHPFWRQRFPSFTFTSSDATKTAFTFQELFNPWKQRIQVIGFDVYMKCVFEFFYFTAFMAVSKTYTVKILLLVLCVIEKKTLSLNLNPAASTPTHLVMIKCNMINVSSRKEKKEKRMNKMWQGMSELYYKTVREEAGELTSKWHSRWNERYRVYEKTLWFDYIKSRKQSKVDTAFEDFNFQEWICHSQVTSNQSISKFPCLVMKWRKLMKALILRKWV